MKNLWKIYEKFMKNLWKKLHEKKMSDFQGGANYPNYISKDQGYRLKNYSMFVCSFRAFPHD